MESKLKLKKIIAVSLVVSFLIGSSAMAASFNFSFVTSSAAVGGVGYKNAASTGGVTVNAYDANLNDSRYISLWGANNASRSITGSSGIYASYTGAYLNYTDPTYAGNLFLWGNPSTIGASANGVFYP